jgi:Cu(I)/Ag(I) efflux system periplasmic protein CusF
MKRVFSFLAAGVLAASVLGQAQAQATSPTTAGEVTKVDKAAAKVTLKHGEIKNLDMPAMSMVFRAKDPKIIEGLVVGDKIRFTAEKINGQYTLTSVTKAP